jgi:hypothetical protein
LVVGAGAQVGAATLKLSGNYSYLEKTCEASLAWAVDTRNGDTTDFAMLDNVGS